MRKNNQKKKKKWRQVFLVLIKDIRLPSSINNEIKIAKNIYDY